VVPVAVPHFLILLLRHVLFLLVLALCHAVLVDLDPVFQLLGPAVFLAGAVTFSLLLVQGLELALERVVTRARLVAGVTHCCLQRCRLDWRSQLGSPEAEASHHHRPYGGAET
jgi:hypothetical protein